MHHLKTTEAELTIKNQLNAYNARDIDNFMLFWADNCQYYAFPSTLLANGAAEIRERHIERFKEVNLHGKLRTRAVVGNMVVDHETVTRTYPDGPGEVDVICIYEVEDKKIVKAWFKMGELKLYKSK